MSRNADARSVPDTDEEVQTTLGTKVLETPKRVYNPVTEEYENVADMSENGYKRRFLAVLWAASRPDVVDLNNSPVLTFDRGKWELTDGPDGQIVIQKAGVSDE